MYDEAITLLKEIETTDEYGDAEKTYEERAKESAESEPS